MKNLSFVLPILIFLACGGPVQPKDFEPGEYQCDYCRMTIADLLFRGEIITKKGKVYRFDSIECLKAWEKEHPEHKHLPSAWVADSEKAGEWIPLSKAFILQSEKIRSPMGAGLAAYRSKARSESAQKEFGGRLLTPKELDAFIIKWKNKKNNQGL